jgi:DNA ligase 1
MPIQPSNRTDGPWKLKAERTFVSPHAVPVLTQNRFQSLAPSRRDALRALLCAPWLGPVAHAEQTAITIPQTQLAMPWPQAQSPQGFLVSEKFDGVRAVWDGQLLRFRSGRLIAAPAWFLSALPKVALDGELWIGRGAFDRLSGVVRQVEPNDAAWREVKYCVFDAPEHAGPFVQRVHFVTVILAQSNQPWLLPVVQYEVKDTPALQSCLDSTVSSGGEGLMLHKASALWRPGRSDALFKLKPALDEEGQVVGHLTGKGRLAGMTGALWLQLPSGQRFALGTGLSDALRRDPPPVGAWVTYRYRDRTPSGLPRFASFVRVRNPE